MAKDVIDRERATAAGDGPRWELARGAEIDPGLAVIADLGGGTRYDVYHAWDRELFCEVVVKMIRPHRVADDRAMEGFEREVAILSRLQHPNLARLLRWTPAPPRPYMVLERVTAPTVADHLDREGAVSVPETALLGIRMCGALHHLHTRGVLHLDVKPSNVTMGDPPRLLDFSLARTVSGPLRMRHSIGTAPYMPPEQCEHGEVTPASDLFALGATLYEAVSAIAAFPEGDDGAEDRTERYPQLAGEAQPLSEIADVPRELEHAVMACLQRDPRRRPSSAVDLAVALERVLEGLGATELYAWPKGMRVRP